MGSWSGPYQQPIDRGYAVTTPRSPVWYGANASLGSPDGDFVELKITELSTNFTIQGAYAQARFKRDFYPQAASQPLMQIKTQCSNQFQHGRIVEFMRTKQIEILQTNSIQTSNVAMILNINGSQFPSKNPPRTTTKGGYRPMSIWGWVTQVSRGGTRFNFAPELEFTFLIWAFNATAFAPLGEPQPGADDAVLNKAQWEQIFDLNNAKFTPAPPPNPNMAPAPAPAPPPPPAPLDNLKPPLENLMQPKKTGGGIIDGIGSFLGGLFG